MSETHDTCGHCTHRSSLHNCDVIHKRVEWSQPKCENFTEHRKEKIIEHSDETIKTSGINTEVIDFNERLEQAISNLKKYDDMEPDQIGKIELRSTQMSISVALQYIQIEYTHHLGKIPLKAVECAVLDKGVKKLFTLPVITDTMNTNIYLMYHPDKETRRRYLSDTNKTIKFDFNDPFYSKNPIYHFIDSSAAASLGYISHEGKLDTKYLYVIAECFGVISYFEALKEIPDEDIYTSLITETELFITQLEEFKDIRKIKYRLFHSVDGCKVLDNIDDGVIKLLQEKGLRKLPEPTKEEPVTKEEPENKPSPIADWYNTYYKGTPKPEDKEQLDYMRIESTPKIMKDLKLTEEQAIKSFNDYAHARGWY